MTVASLKTASPKSAKRLVHLDALRGIAAVVVVAHHALLAIGIGVIQSAPWSVFNIVLLGRPAVILFFVLSGFVLTLHLKATHEGFLSFAVRRLARLMPPYMISIFGAAVLFALTEPHRPTKLSSWFDMQWGNEIGASEIVHHLLMLAGPHQFPLDHVAWSLVHEVRLSLALPFLVWLLRWFGPTVALFAAGGTALIAEGVLAFWPDLFPTGVHGFRFDAEGLGFSLILTARFGFAFALGATLAAYGSSITVAIRRPGLGLLGTGLALVLLSCSNEILMALGATLLVATVAWTPGLAAGLGVRPLLWIGRVSFSLYLVHLPVMLTCVYAGQGFGPAWARLLAGLCVSVPVAAAMTHAIEEPAVRWSRLAARATARYDRRSSVPEQFVSDPSSL